MQPAAAHRGPITIEWVGDITPGSTEGVPPGEGRAQFATARPAERRRPDRGNLEGTFGRRRVEVRRAAAAHCFAFQAPPANAAALRRAGFDVMNLANNHAFDFGASGQAQTLAALHAAQVALDRAAGRGPSCARNGRPGRARRLRALPVGPRSTTWRRPAG